MKKIYFGFIGIVLGCVFLASPAFAGGDGSSGGGRVNGVLDQIEDTARDSWFNKVRKDLVENHGLLISPYFKMGIDFTSNVFGEPTGDKEDVIWTYTPGVNITHTTDITKTTLHYEADLLYFTKHENQNEQNQEFSAAIDYKIDDATSVRASHELIQQGATAGASNAKPLNFLDNTAAISIHREWGDRFRGEGGFLHFNREYEGEIFDRFSYVEYRGHLMSYYEISEGLIAKTGYIFGWADYDENATRNSNFHELPIGLSGKLPWDVRYDATVALHIRNQEQVQRSDFFAAVADVALSKQFPKGTNVRVGFIRKVNESTFDDQPFNDSKTFYTNVTQILSRRARARMNISYSNSDYEEAARLGTLFIKRSDDNFRFGLGTDYALRKWLVLNLDYNLSIRDSNSGDFDYSENRLSMGITIPV